jgi:hypothetical protein
VDFPPPPRLTAAVTSATLNLAGENQRQAESIRTQNKTYIGSTVTLGKVFPRMLPSGHSGGKRTRLWLETVNRGGPMPGLGARLASARTKVATDAL